MANKRRKKLKEKSPGTGIGKYPCVVDGGCGSRDAMEVYEHDDGSHSATCFSCEGYIVNLDFENMCGGGSYKSPAKEKQEWKSNMYLPTLETVRDDYTAFDEPSRKLRESVYNKFNVKMELQGDGVTIDKVFYPSHRNGVHTGYKVRTRFESGHPEVKKDPSKLGKLKCFTEVIGDNKKGIQLFGEDIFDPSVYNGRVILTEGQEDAMTMWHITTQFTKDESGYPCVSPQNGAKVAWVRQSVEYLDRFKEILLCVDQDEAGDKFKKELIKLLPSGKVKVMTLPKGIKDISDYWTSSNSSAKRAKIISDVKSRLYNAKKETPVGIKNLDDVWETYKELGDEILIPLPDCFGALQYDTGGLELGGVHGIVAATSVGKTLFLREIVYNIRKATAYNVGICSAEDTCEEYLMNLISCHISKPLREFSKSERDLDEEFEAMKYLRGEDKDRFHILDNAGTADLDELLEKVEWLIVAQDCKVIVLDPVTLLVGSESSDLDDFMSNILKLAKRHMVAFILVFHTRKTQQGAKAASQGGEVTIEDIKSSGSGGQVCSTIMLLNRNKEHDDETIRNTTTARWGKFRRKGWVTGTKDFLFYEKETSRLTNGQDPAEIEAMLSGEGGGFEDDGPLNQFT